MSENKYESRVWQRADEMAKAAYEANDLSDIVPSWNTPWDKHPDKTTFIKEMLPAARLSVQREAEAYESAYRQLSELRGWKTPSVESHIKGHLQSLGLVPENEQI